MTTRHTIPSLLLLLLLSFVTSSSAYAAPKGTPELNRRAIAGLWRLFTNNPKSLKASSKPPMKEFTVYPKKNKEMLLMLREDGSFQQYDEQAQQAIRGTWDFRDGNLILAADRTTSPVKVPQRDTILVGKVVATTCCGGPAFAEDDAMRNNNNNSTTANTNFKVDVHLSVPQGSVEVGKFFYPQHHPSFFEQPIFRPTSTGSFQLRQVLGQLNTKLEEDDEIIEKFRRDDFYDKRFFLTSHKIGHKPKGTLRWSIKYNKFVEDAPRKKAASQEDTSATTSIHAMELEFFSNHTFATVAGLGEGTVLRGKWDVIGKKRDQLWMQVWRFGFGRSVSGSVYSEGKSLSHNDAKTYWGEISHVPNDKVDDQETSDTLAQDVDSSSSDDDAMPKRLQVIGSVLLGWGLEPLPEARFLMKERSSEQLELNDDDDEEEEEDTTEEDLERTFEKNEGQDDIDWSTAFQ